MASPSASSKHFMNQYLIDLEESLHSVEPDNYFWTAINVNDQEYSQRAENNFASEIKFHFRTLMKSAENKTRYHKLKFHFDVLKGRKQIQPDFVLHESPFNQNQQVFYSELKIDPNCSLKDDLGKLIYSVSYDLNFENAVMIIANKTLASAINQIRKHVVNQNDDTLRKIYLFHALSDENEKVITYHRISFFDIIKENPISLLCTQKSFDDF
ncbi:MAG: hypothetical protein MUW56_02420 [Chryseobacterium sp.]|uniref:hypothetical protein n=1 Tax=Chryseobacterium sp. TaxID=1871047 RepID=UPI0025C4A92D|nr:hypothetical protein [Chryseobacterium sp.]MCJ7932504.1 hypothetical protein [Chryseobacterium sp.]